MKILLASASPRRREILSSYGFDVTVVPSGEEKAPKGLAPAAYVKRLALEKGLDAAKAYPDEITVSADTVVVLDSEIMGKPSCEQDARRMLHALSGRTHKVYTGYAVSKGGRTVTASVVTKVKVRTLSDAAIDAYISTLEPMDKAGAYGIQGLGAAIVEGINGDYLNVVGFPLSHFLETLVKEFGYSLFEK